MRKLLLFLLMLPIAHALSIERADLSYLVHGNMATLEQQLIFTEPTSAHFEIPIPTHIGKLTVLHDGQVLPAEQRAGFVRFDTNAASRLTIRYDSPDFLDGESFVASAAVPLPTAQLRITVQLSPKATLRGNDPEVPAAGAVFPSPTQISSDGESLIIVWERAAITPSDELALYVRYRPSRESQLTLIVLAGVAVVFLLGAFLWYRRKSTPQTPTQSAEPALAKHLKEDEQQVVSILKNREGSCEQGTLRVITGFSKAKLSGLLSELEARNIIFKEKRGKKNLVFLKY